MSALVRVRSVEVLAGYRLRLSFSNGEQGTVDLTGELWGPIFEPLKQQERFAEVRVDPECGTIVWPNGADFAPEWLYEVATTRPSAPV